MANLYPVLGLLVYIVSPVVFAWGQNEHRVTGAIAEPYLSVAAKEQITAILGNESLAEASTWADFMRASPKPFWQKEARADHYVTVPVGKQYEDLPTPKQGDAVTALKKFASELKSAKSTLAQKQLALRFTVHIIGDLHQPLHVGNGEDRGGTRFNVYYFGKKTSLHKVWDYQMLAREHLSYSEKSRWLAKKITPAQATQWSDPNPLVWIAESAKLREQIYPEVRSLSWEYGFKHTAAANRRLSQAGVRIAAYLNALFGSN